MKLRSTEPLITLLIFKTGWEMLCKWKEENGLFYPGDKSFSALVTALQLLSLDLGGVRLEMGWQRRYQQPKRNHLVFSDFKFCTKHFFHDFMNG